MYNRVQITTDGHHAYLEAVETAFGADIDYAQLQKIYGAPAENHTRYSPAKCIGCDMKTRRPVPSKLQSADQLKWSHLAAQGIGRYGELCLSKHTKKLSERFERVHADQ
jgi:hypothetical protein